MDINWKEWDGASLSEEDKKKMIDFLLQANGDEDGVELGGIVRGGDTMIIGIPNLENDDTLSLYECKVLRVAHKVPPSSGEEVSPLVSTKKDREG